MALENNEAPVPTIITYCNFWKTIPLQVSSGFNEPVEKMTKNYLSDINMIFPYGT